MKKSPNVYWTLDKAYGLYCFSGAITIHDRCKGRHYSSNQSKENQSLFSIKQTNKNFTDILKIGLCSSFSLQNCIDSSGQQG